MRTPAESAEYLTNLLNNIVLLDEQQPVPLQYFIEKARAEVRNPQGKWVNEVQREFAQEYVDKGRREELQDLIGRLEYALVGDHLRAVKPSQGWGMVTYSHQVPGGTLGAGEAYSLLSNLRSKAKLMALQAQARTLAPIMPIAKVQKLTAVPTVKRLALPTAPPLPPPADATQEDFAAGLEAIAAFECASMGGLWDPQTMTCRDPQTGAEILPPGEEAVDVMALPPEEEKDYTKYYIGGAVMAVVVVGAVAWVATRGGKY
jgi:hypothetical protein